MSLPHANVCSVPFFANEYWFARRLMRHGIEISGGVTDPAERQGRARRGILERNLAAERVVLNKPDTWADLYRRLYGEPLPQHEPAPFHSLSPTQPEVAL